MKIISLAFLLIAIFISGCQSVRSPSGQRIGGVRLQLTPAQLDKVGSREPLLLTPGQKQRVRARLGKDVSEVWVIYNSPDGDAELGELGYNLALRDRADSVVVLPGYAMNPDEAAKKHADNLKIIGPPERPPKEHASFFTDADGRIWRFVGKDEFTAYAHAHRSNFGIVSIQTLPPENSSTVAYRDTQRFMSTLLSKTTATVSQ